MGRQVAQIITFGTMAARAAIRDVGRALNMCLCCGPVAKMVPMEIGMTIDKALGRSDLRMLYEEDPEARTLIDMSRSLRDFPSYINPCRRSGYIKRPHRICTFRRMTILLQPIS